MKLANIMKDYLSFNKAEQRGIFVMIAILFGLIIADVVISNLLPEERFDFSGFAAEIEDFEKDLAMTDSMERSKKQTRGQVRTVHQQNYMNSSAGPATQKNEEWFVELNSADTFDLQRLRGIGPAFARRIVKYRERLGGFTEKEQLLEVYGFDREKLGQINDHITLRLDSLRKINLNTVTFKELISHPYFPFAITKNVMIYRKEHKQFRSVEELLKVPFIDDSLFRKMKPYLRVD